MKVTAEILNKACLGGAGWRSRGQDDVPAAILRQAQDDVPAAMLRDVPAAMLRQAQDDVPAAMLRQAQDDVLPRVPNPESRILNYEF